ncbi:MAG: hypothetical protein LBU60_03485 [Clostridiales bacterium]|jgi:hypothetical protein|nr:hypothetical protein [Clostridiales bacterium]
MIFFDILICLILFIVPFMVFFCKTYHKRNLISNVNDCKVLDLKYLFDDKKTANLHIIIGVYFACVYLAFRYLGSNWYVGSPLHIIAFLSTLIMPFVLAYLCKGTKKVARTVAIVLSGILLLSPLSRPFIWWANGGGAGLFWGEHPLTGVPQSVLTWEAAIPLNMSNLCALLFLVSICTKNKMLVGFMVCVGLTGGVINNVNVNNGHMKVFWYYLTWESYFVHALMIIIPIFVLLTNQVELKAKPTLKNYYWFIPWFLITGFLLNPLWGTNYNFTWYQKILQKILPYLNHPIGFLNGQFDPLYMSCVLVLLSAMFVLFYFVGIGMTKISKRWYLKVDKNEHERKIF